MINWKRRGYTQEQFKEAWNNALSIADVARELGCNRNSGGYYSIKVAAKSLNLTSDHMTGRAWNQGKRYRKINTPRPLEEILIKDSDYLSTTSLKKRLFEAGLLEKKCSMCGITDWMGQPAPLAIDHINGERTDNRIENLRILCYNCHGQTDTFCSKNRTKNKEA